MMKRVVLACLGMLALAATADAADLPRRYDPVPQRAFVPVYNWTGFYIGINGGGGWGDSKWDQRRQLRRVRRHGRRHRRLQLADAQPMGASASKATSTGPISTARRTPFAWPAARPAIAGWPPFAAASATAFDRFLPYITGGLAVGDIKASQPGFAGGDDTNAGWTVGGGFEFVIAGNWTAKAEYLYVDLGKFNCGLACGNGINPDNVSFSTHLVRGGVNFRF